MRAFQLTIPAYNYIDHVINLKWENHLKLANIGALTPLKGILTHIICLYFELSLIAVIL